MKKLIEFIKNYWLFMVIAAVIIWSVTNIIVMAAKLEKAQDTIQIQNARISAAEDSVYSYRNKTGELLSIIESVEVEKGNLKEALDVAGFDLKKLKDDNIKLRNLNLALNAQLAATGNVNTQVTDTFRITDTDTIYFQKVNDWSNTYLSIFNGTIENKNLNFDYTYKTGISLFHESTRKQSIVTVKLTDPNATITNANSITLDNKKKWYEKWWFWTAAGAAGGIFLVK